MILDRLDNRKLDFNKCRRIGFDHSVRMAGVHCGVLRLLRNINEKAKFLTVLIFVWIYAVFMTSAVNANAITFFRVIEKVNVFLLFQLQVGSFIFAGEGHDKTFCNHPLECTLRSYSCSENRFSRSNSSTQFINLFRKSLKERGWPNHFAFNWSLLFRVMFV